MQESEVSITARPEMIRWKKPAKFQVNKTRNNLQNKSAKSYIIFVFKYIDTFSYFYAHNKVQTINLRNHSFFFGKDSVYFCSV